MLNAHWLQFCHARISSLPKGKAKEGLFSFLKSDTREMTLGVCSDWAVTCMHTVKCSSVLGACLKVEKLGSAISEIESRSACSRGWRIQMRFVLLSLLVQTLSNRADEWVLACNLQRCFAGLCNGSMKGWRNRAPMISRSSGYLGWILDCHRWAIPSQMSHPNTQGICWIHSTGLLKPILSVIFLQAETWIKFSNSSTVNGSRLEISFAGLICLVAPLFLQSL